MASPIDIFIVSDSSGETALTIAQTAAAQFPNAQINYQRFPFIKAGQPLTETLNRAKQHQAVVFFTLVNQELSLQVETFCRHNGLSFFDCIQPAMQALSHRTGLPPVGVPSINRNLTDTYFDRISAMEFAVTYDDGKNPDGLLKADLVVLGVSRTSKTPLSLFLANRSIKVANLPLAPRTQLPDVLWQINPNKMVGLTTTPGTLRRIRQQRMLSYGLPAQTAYSNTKTINAELKYAADIYQKIGCLVINVAHKSIEETATIILESPAIDWPNGRPN